MAPISNTTVVHDILKARGMRFTPPIAGGATNQGSEVTTLSFNDLEGALWTLYIFSHKEAAYLRFYSYIAQPTSIFPAHVLELVNYINFSTLFESSLDLGGSPTVVRFKAAFKGVGIGLPVHETDDAIQSHITRSAYLHYLLKMAYRYPIFGNPQQTLINAHEKATEAGFDSPQLI